MSQPFSNAKVSASASAGQRAGCENRARCRQTGPRLRAAPAFRSRPRRSRARSSAARQTAANDRVRRSDSRARSASPAAPTRAHAAPQHRHERARRAALRQKSGDAEQRRPGGGKQKVRAIIVALRFGDGGRGRAGRRDQNVERFICTAQSAITTMASTAATGTAPVAASAAPGDGDRRGGENDKSGQRDASCGLARTSNAGEQQ